ncbi:hypothetical protein NHX12_003214 [Muraenolepis orangiensis]|uniref:Reelin domain-containing protein n=1 Tax=Muraenolepis orangiensis TaxID=630683 RepID=A0A9Q0IFL2_9TELE|nr:hypothetical protein NHX12_003214 [Muraenolepis orangiensis]
MPERPFSGTQFVCSVVASHVSHQPSSSFSFMWIAPPPGTGCVNFLSLQFQFTALISSKALAPLVIKGASSGLFRGHSFRGRLASEVVWGFSSMVHNVLVRRTISEHKAVCLVQFVNIVPM